jgi:hypothetical protein
MVRRLIILDSALVLLLAFGGAKFRQDWLAFGPAHQVSQIQPEPENLPGLPAPASEAATAADWTAIPAQNPFSFDRNDIAILAPPPEPAKPLGPKPVLFGTMSMGQGWIAMVASGQTQNRNSRPFRVGEAIDGWTIVEIAEKSVVVEADSIRETLSTNDWMTLQIPRDSARTVAAVPSSMVQSVAQPASSSTSSSSAAPAPSTTAPTNPSGPAGAQRMCSMQTPFGIVSRPCEDNR